MSVKQNTNSMKILNFLSNALIQKPSVCLPRLGLLLFKLTPETDQNLAPANETCLKHQGPEIIVFFDHVSS